MLTTHELVNVLTARVNSIEKQLRDCQRENMALAGQMRSMMNIKPQAIKFNAPDGMVGRQATQARWSMWKVMHESGKKNREIAREFGVSHKAVCYARQMNWNAKEGK